MPIEIEKKVIDGMKWSKMVEMVASGQKVSYPWFASEIQCMCLE